MKQLILIFTFLTAFAVNGFAYSGSAFFELDQEGYRTESITMNCEHVYINMGTSRPGYVEVYGYRSDGGPTLYQNVSYPKYGDWSWHYYPISMCQINIVVGSEGYGSNGIYIQWW